MSNLLKFLDVTPMVGTAAEYSGSLDDCLAMAALFANTCDSTTEPLSSISAHQGDMMTCTGINNCPGTTSQVTYTTENPCQYYRKTCVTCSETDGMTKMRFQFNGMPDHCFQSLLVAPLATSEYDFEVQFNRDVTGLMNYEETDIDSVTKTTELLCDIQRTSSSNFLADTYFTSDLESSGSTENLETASGMALTGAQIFNALGGGDVDAIENEWITLDQCLTHPTPFAEYHYHSWSPCINSGTLRSTSTSPGMCEDAEECYTDPMSWAISGGWLDTENWGGMVGVAKDGHPIYGPYNSDGELWTCDDHDICNGRFFDNGTYGYVSTSTFPYVLGCWGPGPQQTNAATCTNASCGTADAATNLALSTLATVATVFSLIY